MSQSARCGKSRTVYSDNFVGAFNRLKRMQAFIGNLEVSINDTFAKEGIEWSLIPAHLPILGVYGKPVSNR